jgi:predicted transposase YbfD/YdcC
MRETELRRLLVEEFLEFVEDPRVARTRKHSLETILVLSVLAVICGADSFVEIEEYGELKQEWLSTFLDLSNGIPSHDTIGRVLALLSTTQLTQAFQRWTRAMAELSRSKLVAIDGKTLRRSFKHAGDHAFVHMVSAWSHANQAVLGQVKTDDKSNEVTAIPALLDLLDIRKALVTIDAAGTQTEIAEKIVDKGGDYLLALKANQPTLHTSVQAYFEERCEGQLLDSFETHARAHGRDETRRAWVSNTVISLESASRWKGLATVVRVDATRVVRGTTSRETRFYISSRAGLTAKQALHAVRSHWGIENGLHWVLDTAFREDESRIRAGNAAANFSALRSLALTLLKLNQKTKVGIKIRRSRAGWDNDVLLQTIGLAP